MRWWVGMGAVAVCLAGTHQASHAGVKAPAASVSASGYHVWIDGMYDRMRLPAYALGLHGVAQVGGDLPDLGTVQSFDPRLNGGGVRGAIGYHWPNSTIGLEIGGSYVGAYQSLSENTSTTTNFISSAFLNGSLAGFSGFTCRTTFRCTTAGTLNTRYDAWQVNGKITTEWTFGSATLTPSATLFGGQARVHQTLSQDFTQLTVPAGTVQNSGAYAADTSLRWTDIGVRFGLDANAALTKDLAIGIGGWIGFANRHISLSGSDSSSSQPTTIYNGGSSVAASDRRGVLLANAEIKLAYGIAPMATLRGFAGLNYDGSVPGITTPSFSGVNAGISQTTAIPADIGYSHQTSYYAGGGLTVVFGR